MTQNRRDLLDRDGWCVVPGLLGAGEVRRLRGDVRAAVRQAGRPFAMGLAVPDAAAEAQALGWIFGHRAVLDAVRSALGSDELTFVRESNAHLNTTSNWHKDTGEHLGDGGYFGCDPFEGDRCRVVKIGVYLQDHADGSGLRLRRGSHHHPDLTSGDEVVLDLRAGDAVIFDVRVTHCGEVASRAERLMGRALATGSGAGRPRVVASARSTLLRIQRRPARLAVFFAFGPPGPMTETYARRNLERQLAQLGRGDKPLPPDLRAVLDDAGVLVAQGLP